MPPTSDLLVADERCRRLGFWSLDWTRSKMYDVQFLERALRVGLTTPRSDFGEAAGEALIETLSRRELETSAHDVYSTGIHLASLADILSTALRKSADKPWRVPDPVAIGKHAWRSSAFLDPAGMFLRRVVLVSNWNDERHYQECRTWSSLGEVCIHNAPLQMVVAVIGQSRNGKRHSYWTHGIRHPFSKKLRFRRRNFVGEGFKDTWREVWREDDDTFPTTEWLDAMQADGVLQDVCFRVDVEVPKEEIRKRILDLAEKKLDRIMTTQEVPEPSLSVCSFPRPCPFLNPCSRGDAPNGSHGFLRLDRISGAGLKA